MEIAIAAVVLVILVVCARVIAASRRRANLLAKYGDARVVERIMAHKIWQGMNAEQLLDSWGRPVDIGKRVYKRKVVETFKYNQTGKNRFASRVTVENGLVVGWEQK